MRLRKKKTFMDHAAEFAESAMETIESAYESAKESAKEAGSNAKDAAGPMLADAKDRAVPLFHDARDRAVPLIAEGRAAATEKAGAGAAFAKEKAAVGAALAAEQAASGKDLASAKIARLKGEPEPKSGGKLKKFLLVSGLLALGGLVFKRFRDRQAADNWQSSYVPPPMTAAPVPTASPTDGLADPLNDPLPGPAGDDPGGAGPDEAISDAAEAPHLVTTPDDPADVVELDRADEEGMISPLPDEKAKK